MTRRLFRISSILHNQGGPVMHRTRFNLARTVMVLAAGVLWAGDLRAASMVSPTAVLGTSLGENSPADAPLVNMINQSGLDKPFTSGVTDFDAYLTTGDPPFAQAHFSNNWQSELSFTVPVTGHVDFDFGAVQPIDRLAIWNI